MAANQTHGDIATKIPREYIDNKVAETSFKEVFRVSFKGAWKVSHPVKTIKIEKFKFHCLSCKKICFVTIREGMMFKIIEVSCFHRVGCC